MPSQHVQGVKLALSQTAGIGNSTPMTDLKGMDGRNQCV